LTALLKTIRPLNLFILALMQFLIRYCIILPAYRAEYFATKVFPDHLLKIQFLLFVFATVLIAAGGNIINDVFDTDIDAINKPGKNLVGKEISDKTAARVGYAFLKIGSIIGLVLGFMNHLTAISLLFPFSAVTLYMYSAQFKKRLLIGNVLIALLTAFSVLLTGLFEPHFFKEISIWIRGSEEMNYVSGAVIILVYALFAFLISLIREVIKDAEDMDGDERAQAKTFPILFGIKATKVLVITLIILTAGIIGYFLFHFFAGNSEVNVYYLLATFLIPFLALLYLIFNAGEKKDFYYASIFCKVIMVLGVLSIIPFYYVFLR
jgi:4-hydroxybenzoate polyprenyltransferase